MNQGDTWKIESAREAVASGETKLVAKSGGETELELQARLLPRERKILLAGGMLKYLQAGGQDPINVVRGDSASAESGGPQSGNRS